MNDDFAAIVTGKPSAAPAPVAAPARDPGDALIRTVYGEAPPDATPQERQAIAAVIVNRARAKGGDQWQAAIPGVVLEGDGGQFNAWKPGSKNRQRIEALKPDSPEYKAIAADVGDIISGKVNPYPEFTNYYAPEAQATLSKTDGRPVKPSFDDGTGTRIGASLFFGGAKPAGDDFAAVIGGGAADKPTPEEDADFAKEFGNPAKWDAASADLTSAGATPYRDLPGKTLSKGQEKTFETMNKAGSYKPDDPPGSQHNLLFMGPDTQERDVAPGVYYVTRPGVIKRQPGAESADGKFTEGFSRGAGDVLLSVADALPGHEDSSVANRFKADQMFYDADHKGELKAGLGRFTGQVAASAPMMAAGEAALALKGGPVAEFLLGHGGGHLLARGASKAVSGAIEGAGGAGLTSSASDAPVGDQMLTGALFGAVAKPAMGAVEGGVRRVVGGGAAARAGGAAPAAEQRVVIQQSTGLPVPIPMTTGEVTGAPGQQLFENGMLKGQEGDGAARVMQGFKADQQAAIRGNVTAIGSQLSGGPEIAVGESGKIVSARLNAARDAVKATIDQNYATARAKGEDAMLATAKDLREGSLALLRERYDLADIEPVARKLEAFGEGGAPTVREVYDLRSKLSSLTQSSDRVVGGAAKAAVRSVDDYMKVALKNDLLVGDPKAVGAWRKAIQSRAAFGRLFEGNDMIEALTARASRGGESDALKVAPEDATNYIFNRSSLGMVGKKDLKRDLVRMRSVLGPDSDAWNAMRAETFKRIARAGEGPGEAGATQFSGQKFFNAWTKMKADDPELLGVVFSPEERSLIDNFASTAQRATTAVKGGDNYSNSAFTMRKIVEKWAPFLTQGGGAAAGASLGSAAGPAGSAGGAAVGSVIGAIFDAMREGLKVGKAVKATRGLSGPVKPPGLQSKLIPSVLPVAAGIAGNRLTGQTQPVQ